MRLGPPRLFFLAVLTLSAVPVISSPARATRWAEFLPAQSWVDEDLRLLRAEGRLPSLPDGTRPLARTDVAQALVEELGRHADAARDPVFRRLWREFAREIAESPRGDSLRVILPTRETPPLVELGDARVKARAYAYASGLARGAPDSSLDVLPGSRVGARAYLRLPHGIGVFEEWTAGRVENARRFGDYIAGIKDFAEDVPRAYVSAAFGDEFRLQAGRDAARWGRGATGALLLSDAAGPMTTLAATATLWHRLTATTRTGVLSAEQGRYLAAHRLEWHPSERFSLGLSEAAVYVSRSPEPLYVIGLLPYTIVQRKVNEDAASDSTLSVRLRNNLEASVDAVWRPAAGWEARGEVLVDDVRLSEGLVTQDRGGVQAGLTRVTQTARGPLAATIEYTRISRFTGSVFYSENGDRDFQIGGRPLGFALGPDCEDAMIDVGWNASTALRTGVRVEQIRRGAERLGEPWRPGDPTSDGWKLVDPVERQRSALITLRYQPRDFAIAQTGVGIVDATNAGNVAGAHRRGPVGWVSLEVRR